MNIRLLCACAALAINTTMLFSKEDVTAVPSDAVPSVAIRSFELPSAELLQARKNALKEQNAPMYMAIGCVPHEDHFNFGYGWIRSFKHKDSQQPASLYSDKFAYGGKALLPAEYYTQEDFGDDYQKHLSKYNEEIGIMSPLGKNFWYLTSSETFPYRDHKPFGVFYLNKDDYAFTLLTDDKDRRRIINDYKRTDNLVMASFTNIEHMSKVGELFKDSLSIIIADCNTAMYMDPHKDMIHKFLMMLTVDGAMILDSRSINGAVTYGIMGPFGSICLAQDGLIRLKYSNQSPTLDPTSPILMCPAISVEDYQAYLTQYADHHFNTPGSGERIDIAYVYDIVPFRTSSRYGNDPHSPRWYLRFIKTATEASAAVALDGEPLAVEESVVLSDVVAPLDGKVSELSLVEPAAR
jgi:hypothetical protein